MSKNTEYMRNYMKQRWQQRRLSAVDILGGKCVKCGSEHNLEFDHIDPQTKSFTIASNPSASEEKFKAELKKCQLLCSKCHVKKNKLDGSHEAKPIAEICVCGYILTSTKQKAGHKRWCGIGFVTQEAESRTFNPASVTSSVTKSTTLV